MATMGNTPAGTLPAAANDTGMPATVVAGDAPAGPGGFTALIDALLQAAGPAAQGAALPASAVPPAVASAVAVAAGPANPAGAASSSVAGAGRKEEEASSGCETPDAWLLALALSQLPPGTSPPAPTAAVAPNQGGEELPRAAAGTMPPAVSPAAPSVGVDALPQTSASMTGQLELAGKAAAEAVPASDLTAGEQSQGNSGSSSTPSNVEAAAGDRRNAPTPARADATIPALTEQRGGDAATGAEPADPLAGLAEAGRVLAAASGKDERGSGDAAGGTGAGTNPWVSASHRATGTAQPAASPAPAASGEVALREPVGTAKWKEELGAQLTLMAARGQQSGSLRVNPEHLGPVEVQITVTDERASVQFGAQHADTRAALQESLPRLREMFSAAGLTLGQAAVSQQAPRQYSGPHAHLPAGSGFRGDGDGEPSPAAGPVRSVTHLGLLDTYA